MSDIRPRQWAADIAALPTVEQRRALLKQVPERIRPLVKTHLRITWERRKANNNDTTNHDHEE
ncbi:MAG: hypothetical protein WEB57_08235 [Pseudohongiellaceae bacterium]